MARTVGAHILERLQEHDVRRIYVHPDRPLVAVEGDGAMQMNGISSLIDVGKYRDRWRDPRFVVLVLNGIRVDAPDQVGDAWDRALAADRPVVLEAVTDPEVPPLPPHIEFQQARNMAAALAKGDPARGEIVRQALKAKLKDVVSR